MRRYLYMVSAAIVLTLMIAACGANALPQYEVDATSVSAARTSTVVALLTEGAIVPTETPTITPSPTVDFAATDAAIQATSDAQATLDAEAALAEANAQATSDAIATVDAQATLDAEATLQAAQPGADDPLFDAIAAADPENGELLFAQNAVPICTTCHYVVENPDGPPLPGPNQWALFSRTVERIEDGIIDADGPYSHIYDSIVNPNNYIVEGYNEGLMIQTYGDSLSEEELYDLVAYLASLEN